MKMWNKISPRWVDVAIVVCVIGAFAVAIGTHRIGPKKPAIEVDPLESVIHTLSGRMADRSAVQNQRLIGIIDRLRRIEASVVPDPAKPVTPEASKPVKPSPDAPEQTRIENAAPTIRLYTADPGWSCGPCNNQHKQLKANTPAFAYDVIYCPRDGKSPTGRYPCWEIITDGKSVTYPGVQTTSRLNQLASPKRVQPVSVSGQFWTMIELRDWIRSNYNQNTRLTADVQPRSSVWQHLKEHRHNFKSNQVSGLSQWEALALHDAAHDGRIRPQK